MNAPTTNRTTSDTIVMARPLSTRTHSGLLGAHSSAAPSGCSASWSVSARVGRGFDGIGLVLAHGDLLPGAQDSGEVFAGRRADGHEAEVVDEDASTFGVMNAGRVGPMRMSLMPRYSSVSRMRPPSARTRTGSSTAAGR